METDSPTNIPTRPSATGTLGKKTGSDSIQAVTAVSYGTTSIPALMSTQKVTTTVGRNVITSNQIVSQTGGSKLYW